MSLKLDFNICENSSCKWVSFKELTGIYNDTTNLNGWGDPNPEVTDYEPGVNSDAALLVTLPDGSTAEIDLSDYFPVNDTTFSINITNEDLGLDPDASLPNGIYTFTYTLTVEGGSYSRTHSVLITCKYECQIQELLHDLVTEECCLECDNEDLDKIVYLKTLLCAAKLAVKCGNKNRAQNILDTIADLLAGSTDCNC
jgi:hypothetical protein